MAGASAGNRGKTGGPMLGRGNRLKVSASVCGRLLGRLGMHEGRRHFPVPVRHLIHSPHPPLRQPKNALGLGSRIGSWHEVVNFLATVLG